MASHSFKMATFHSFNLLLSVLVKSLCHLFSVYAQYMTCFHDRRQKSDWCFDNRLNISVNDLTEDDLCG